MAKAKKSKAKKSKAKKSKAKKTKKAKRRAAASRGPAKKSKAKKSKAKKAKKPPAKPKAKAKRAIKAAPKKKKQMIGEGDYEGSRRFLKDESSFVKRHSAKIPAMGREAEAALDGPGGGELRAAEEEAKSHSKASGE